MKNLLAVFLALPLGGCSNLSSEMCSNEIIQEISSPSGQSKAVIFQRDCSATTSFSTQVSIIPAQFSLGNDGSNIFVTDDNSGAAPSGRGGGPSVWVKWLGANKLKIVYDRRAATFAMKKQHQGVSIVYQTN